MPTARPRHMVTETDELRAALDDAARRWPGLRRSQLLVRLAIEGHRAAVDERDERHRRRLDAVRRHRGALTGVYEPDERDRLRLEWPP